MHTPQMAAGNGLPPKYTSKSEVSRTGIRERSPGLFLSCRITQQRDDEVAPGAGGIGPRRAKPSWPVVDPVVARPSGAVLYSLGSNGARTPYLASNARIVSGTSVARLINEFVG